MQCTNHPQSYVRDAKKFSSFSADKFGTLSTTRETADFMQILPLLLLAASTCHATLRRKLGVSRVIDRKPAATLIAGVILRSTGG
jgi:hypothetical protein